MEIVSLIFRGEGEEPALCLDVAAGRVAFPVFLFWTSVYPHAHMPSACLDAQVGLDSVSTSPLRVPIARLAAAQAAIKAKK